MPGKGDIRLNVEEHEALAADGYVECVIAACMGLGMLCSACSKHPLH